MMFFQNNSDDRKVDNLMCVTVCVCMYERCVKTFERNLETESLDSPALTLQEDFWLFIDADIIALQQVENIKSVKFLYQLYFRVIIFNAPFVCMYYDIVQFYSKIFW